MDATCSTEGSCRGVLGHSEDSRKAFGVEKAMSYEIRIKVPSIDDKTTDPEVPLWLRHEVYKICEEANREEEGKEFRLVITEFEISTAIGDRLIDRSRLDNLELSPL